MQITWLGHGSFALEVNGEHLVIDPWLGNPKYPAGYTIAACDTILVTHGHFDHTDGVAGLAGRFQAKVIANYEIATWLGSKGVANVVGMNKGGSVATKAAKVTMVQAIHSSTIQDGDQIIPAGEPCGFVIHLGGGRTLYFAGDTAVHSDMALLKELYAPEIAVLPIGDLYTMDPLQAALAAKLVGARTVIPMHYGTFDALTGTPSELRALVGPGVAVQELEPGVAWTF